MWAQCHDVLNLVLIHFDDMLKIWLQQSNYHGYLEYSTKNGTMTDKCFTMVKIRKYEQKKKMVPHTEKN